MTKNYFPKLVFTEDYLPVGTASIFCMHLSWSKKEQRMMYDRYYPVENLPNCTEASNPKYNWQRNDPLFGLDFRVWK